MKLSIIMPIFNGEEYLQRSINSIITQKIDCELLLVDDGSSDRSFEICKEYQKKYDFIKLYKNTEGKGTCSARNFALSRISGDIVSFCDQDDYFEDNSLKIVIDYFEKNEISVLITAFNSITNIEKKYRGFGKNFYLSNYEAIPYSINDLRITGCCWSKFYKRNDIEGIKFDEDLSYAEDIVFVNRVLYKNKDKRCLISKEPVYVYYDGNPNNLTNDISKRFDEKNNLKYINCFERIRTFCENDKLIDDEVGYIIIVYAINTLRSINVDNEKKKILISKIKDNLGCLIRLMFKYDIISNVKRLICALLYITGLQ